MRILTVLVFFLTGMNASAYADYFQFIDRQGNFYLSHRAVFIADNNFGYTDGYGRIRIDYQHGQHIVILKKQRVEDLLVEVVVDGEDSLKVISVP